jgi:hypothetical protein
MTTTASRTTKSTWARLGWALGLAASLTLTLAGCGGGSSNSSSDASVRLVNASAGYGLLDLYVDGTQTLSSVGFGQASSYTSISSGSAHTVMFTRSGSSTAVISPSLSFSSGSSYTVLAYGWEGHLATFELSDDQGAPDSGKASLRVVNAAPDAGALDVYVTAATDSLTDVSPVSADVAGGTLTGFNAITQGTYRIRVTAAGDKTDVRLDVSNISLSDQEVATLVLTPTSGGVLVNALVAVQKGAVTSYTNPYARARLVAAVTGNAGVAAAVGGTTLSSGSRAPLVASYTLVPTGLLPLDVKVNGSAISAGSATVSPGADLSVMVYGDAANPQVAVLTDDNRLPSVQSGSSGKAKVRLVNALYGLDSGLSLVVGYSALADDLAYGAASSYSTLTGGSNIGEVDVTSPLQASALYSATDVTLQTDGVYTVFMMGGASAPAGTLRRDR